MTTTLVIAQINLLVGDIAGNAAQIIATARDAAKQYQADLVVFPELTLTGYPPEDLLFRPGLYTQCEAALTELCQITDLPALLIGHPQKVNHVVYNQASLIQQGRIIASYRKQILPNYAVFDEKRYFEAGAEPCVITLKDIRFGITICEDMWFPTPAQQAAAQGAEVLISLNASPFDRNKARLREAILAQRATETGLPIVYANLVGGQDELVFDGGSMVVAANGQIIQQADYYQAQLLPVVITRDAAKAIHIQSTPLPPPLSPEAHLYQTLVLGVRDYIEKNHFPSAIIGLSGGIDSALTLAIAVDAIGCDRVTAVMMPSRYTHEISSLDAQAQAELLGVHYEVIAIEPIMQAFMTSLAPLFADAPTDTTEENLQARIRGSLLMALSNKHGHILLSTGNKSEMAVGYATLYGDMAGGFAMLKDIPKTEVYRLADYRNQLSPTIPQRVIERAPTAELAPNQLDQDSLPPYPILDDILRLYIELDQPPSAIYAAGFDPAVVNKVIKMVIRNEYKRRQAPVGIRTTERAFGKDRRYPITSGYGRCPEQSY